MAVNGKLKILTVLMFIFTLAVSTVTFAATSGSTGSATIVVNTGSKILISPSITLTQRKAKATCLKTSLTLKQSKVQKQLYAAYDITVKKDGRKVTTKHWSNGSITIKLEKNSDYEIVVEYNDIQTWLKSNAKLISWDEPPQWNVSKVNKVDRYF